MPKDKDFKRVVRTRMAKTGESYTAARAHLLDTREPPGADDMAESSGKPDDLAGRAGMPDETVVRGTGRNWAEWTRWLDDADAARLPHRDIARLVAAEEGISGWWAQSVTVGYERIKGLREIGQRRGGTFDANKSRTIKVPVAELYRMIADDEQRSRWMDDTGAAVRSTRPDKTVRMVWHDETAVDLYLDAKGPAKTTLTVQHRKLSTREEADAARQAWHRRLDTLQALTEG